MRYLISLFVLFSVCACKSDLTDEMQHPVKFVITNISQELDIASIIIIRKRDENLLTYSMGKDCIEVDKGDKITLQYVGRPVSHNQKLDYYFDNKPNEVHTIYTAPISATQSVIIATIDVN